MELSNALKNARLTAMQNFLDAGSNPARIEIYTGSAASGGNTPADWTLLCTMTLTRPCGSVSAGRLTLSCADAQGPLVLASGEARQARCLSGDGSWAFDCPVFSAESGQSVGMIIGGTASGPNAGALIYKDGRLPPTLLRIDE